MVSRILIIEDDNDLREGLSFSLEMEGYDVESAQSKQEGGLLFRQGGWQLVLLDCNLPDGNGFDFLQEMRAFSDVPIFMLTARNTEIDEVKALELGVADFMSKPFSLAVLKARIRKILAQAKDDEYLVSGGITIHKTMCAVMKSDVPVSLSKVEYQLLLYLVENREHVLTKEQILSHVWDTHGKYVDENTLSVTIRRLRAKIEENAAQPKRIRTVHGIGYVWKEGSV